MAIESLNFGFLAPHDPLLVTSAARAEAYALDDPNTSLIKTRQFSEYLARHVAAHHGLETIQMEFRGVLRILAEKRLIPREVRDQFDVVRMRGNEAVHELVGTPQMALASLISAHWPGVWFHRTFVDPKFVTGPFRPPVAPSQSAKVLREEVDLLRSDVDRYEQ